MKEKLLYLCHRIPFPANKGDKIATCNILKYLNKHYDIYLGCFIDDPFDFQYKNDVRLLCKDAFFVELNTTKSKIKGLSAIFSGTPITLPYYHSHKMNHWVQKTIIENNIKTAFVFSSCMAQYLLGDKLPEMHNVIHFADIDSDKWRQYAEKRKGLMRWIYTREHKTLEQYEKHVADKFSISCFVSEAETATFQNMLAKEQQQKIRTLCNGIDCDFFSPETDIKLSEQYSLKEQNYIVFTGAMDYWANADAVSWFAEHVWTKVNKKLPDSLFYIVGSSPSKQVLNLQEIPGIIVTGRVEDIRPYLSHAKAAVAPMQIARGIQNKILEAMAMEKIVITTRRGIEGIENYPKDHLHVSESSDEITNWVIDLLTNNKQSASKSRDWLKQTYSWEAKLAPLLSYLKDRDSLC
ncbi:TIGR03087 family PEP-CTERM/XrtA system glycosyltransferase [Vibrio salinus]|uniref:TIGR03087 family PEP-CTERM/XrtA system glycosyltransferase n=1 Tax=Vibrio salinus TaxID=2899784 RepID=UPI001E4DC487|nr:TIGR03087 family PEP-CTERM/XrtA system glycosyltransferase [Vibrio salinus]MCE0493263.1 TIGR03087 family PEP-CTERM/XrtA system glycosyltransferase [Vibrio salinus]